MPRPALRLLPFTLALALFACASETPEVADSDEALAMQAQEDVVLLTAAFDPTAIGFRDGLGDRREDRRGDRHGDRLGDRVEDGLRDRLAGALRDRLDPAAIRAALAERIANALECVTIDTDRATYVTATFAGCAGPLAPSGTIHLEASLQASPPATIFDLAIDMIVRGASIDGAWQVVVPLDETAARTFAGDLHVVGAAGQEASFASSGSWLRSGGCVTYSAHAEGQSPRGSFVKDVTDQTRCGE